ncbi:hypothetical protein B0H11DRAFT_1163545 [Mycena galericulata]|nr:hypothetical protein B0H11DRAFT_1163545 [Mycena galericulata]
MSLFPRRTPLVLICGLFAACIALERAPVRALRRRIRTRRPLRYFSFYARPNHPGRTPEPRLSASHISTLRVTSPPRQRLPPRVPESDQSASPAQDTSRASSARPESTLHMPPSSGAALRAHNARRRRASSPPDSARLLLQRTPKSAPSALAGQSFPARHPTQSAFTHPSLGPHISSPHTPNPLSPLSAPFSRSPRHPRSSVLGRSLLRCSWASLPVRRRRARCRPFHCPSPRPRPSSSSPHRVSLRA